MKNIGVMAKATVMAYYQRQLGGQRHRGWLNIGNRRTRRRNQQKASNGIESVMARKWAAWRGGNGVSVNGGNGESYQRKRHQRRMASASESAIEGESCGGVA
jgi:hypothetical protein